VVIFNWTALLLVASVKLGINYADAFVTTSKILQTKHGTELGSNQLLSFVEPTTNVTVQLVGSMHYNPYSIQVAENTISDLAKKDQLGSVIIESCDIRWQTTNDLNPLLQKFLQSEMRAACDVALEANRPVVLGDQRINITVDRMGRAFQETIFDVVRPDQGGWQRIWSNITSAFVETSAPKGEDNYLGATAFLDPKLLLQAPISFIKYPLSYVIKSPLTTIALATLFYLTNRYSDATMIPLDDVTLVDWVPSLYVAGSSLFVAGLEQLIFIRITTKEILADRNKILAQSILDQCRIYQHDPKEQPSTSIDNFLGWFGASLMPKQNKEADMEEIIRYVPTNNTAGTTNNGAGAKTVVAVLGMAHCNGIAKLLREQRVS